MTTISENSCPHIVAKNEYFKTSGDAKKKKAILMQYGAGL
jgi:hypothetical protein